MSTLLHFYPENSKTSPNCILNFHLLYFTVLHYFIHFSDYISKVSCFLQIEGLWQCCIEQVYWAIGVSFSTALVQFTSLCHILVILAVFQTFSFLYLSWWFVIRWVIVNVTLVIVLGHHEAFPHKMVNLIPKCCVCSEYYISLLVLFLKEGLVWLQYRKLINNPTVGD